jgi:hypothetical protein
MKLSREASLGIIDCIPIKLLHSLFKAMRVLNVFLFELFHSFTVTLVLITFTCPNGAAQQEMAAEMHRHDIDMQTGCIRWLPLRTRQLPTRCSTPTGTISTWKDLHPFSG